MIHQTPVMEIIKKRYSCRTYAPAPISRDQQKSLNAFLSENRTGPFGTSARFKLITATEKDHNELKALGTYGVIKNPAGFIIGAVKGVGKNGANDLEDFGYAMEKNILFVTRMGLGTCWLGGTFTKSTFAGTIDLEADESIPAVASIGHIAAQKSLLEKTMRWGAGADSRKPWQTIFFKNTWDQPLPPEEAGKWGTPLEMVRIGPSASNRQPWRIVRQAEGAVFHFYMQRSRGYHTRNRMLFGMTDLQRVDMGIAMCHFEMTAVEIGLDGKWRVDEPGPDVGRLPDAIFYIASWAVEKGAR